MATRLYSDFDMAFAAHPATGDVVRKYDDYAIKQSIRNLVFLNHYEKPFHPEIGSQVTGLLFENYTPILETLIQRSIVTTIDNFEPRVKLIEVVTDFKPDNNSLDVTITYQIRNTDRISTVELTLYRAR